MRGFGSKLISRSVANDLDGALSYDWQESGLVATLRMRKIGPNPSHARGSLVSFADYQRP